jgi:RNA recognition motif-containing protein
MIRNIPINNFTQVDMVALIDKDFKGLYNYFYLPKDMKTQQGVGFCFINFIHPVFIIDFCKQFHKTKWSDRVARCKSQKCCEISYAKFQGLNQIKSELIHKKTKKKKSTTCLNQPLVFEDLRPDEELV